MVTSSCQLRSYRIALAAVLASAIFISCEAQDSKNPVDISPRVVPRKVRDAEGILESGLKTLLESASYDYIRSRTPPVLLPAVQNVSAASVEYRVSVLMDPRRKTRLRFEYGDGQNAIVYIPAGTGFRHGITFRHIFAEGTKGEIVQKAILLDLDGLESEGVTIFG